MKAPPDLRLLGLQQNEVLLGPQSVHIDITNSCNTNCITCWDHSPHLRRPPAAAWKRQRVGLSEVQELLDDLQELGGLKAIVLSGMGEPFTHPQAEDMVADIKSRNLHLTIITNLIAAPVERIVELGVDELLIGVQGASQASYEAFHPNFAGGRAWQVLLEKLEFLRSAGRGYKHVQVICRPNAEELPAMVDMAAHYGATQLNFKLASLKEGTEAVEITPEQRHWLLQEGIGLARQRAEQLGVNSNLEVFALQLAAGPGKTAPIREVGCFMGHYYARVLVDGSVLYCCNVDVRVGSLREQRFSQLWKGEAWQQLRQRLRQGNYFESCQQCGKFNQNVKIGQRFARHFGEDRLRAITGQ